MKKIGLVLPETPQYSETFFNYKIKGLQESGFDVIVFTGKKEKGKFSFKIKNSYPVFINKPLKQFIFSSAVIKFTFFRSPLNTIALYKLERKSGKSILNSLKSVYLNAHILTHNLDWLHFGFATMALKRENVAKAIGAKMGLSFRGFDINIYPLKNPGCYRRVWENVNKIHTISEYLYGKALSLGLSPDVPFEKITPAIDVSSFNVKDDLGIIKNKLKILTVGRLNWIKDYETAISAMKLLKEKGTDFIYNIAGAGPEFERLTFAVYQCGLQDRINFLGKKDHGEINRLMRESDIYLQTSMQEGFCVSALEAQATGLLCVVSDADGLKENIKDGVTGWIAERRNPKDFADKIEKVLKMTDDKRKEVAMNARKRVEMEFTLKQQKSKFAKFFNS